MQQSPRFIRQCGWLLVAAALAPAAHAETRVKNGTAGNLNVAGNWAVGLPGANDLAQWDSTSTLSNPLGANLSWMGISVTTPTGAVSITGSDTLTIGMAGIDLSTATQNLTISSNFTLLANRRQIWNVGSGRVLALDGTTFTRGAGATLNVQGAGTVTMPNLSNDSTGIVGTWASIGTGVSSRYAAMSGTTISSLTGTQAATAAQVTDITGAFNYDVNGVGALGAGASVNTMRYTGAGGTITGNFSANGLMNAGTGALVMSGNVAIGQSRELVVNGANAATTISGRISDNIGGASSITKTGGSTLTLSGDNDYTGATIVSSGVLTVTHNNALGSTATGTTVIGGDTASSGNPALPGGQVLVQGNGLNIAEAFTFIGRGNNQNPRVLSNAGGNNTLSGAITLDAAGGSNRWDIGTGTRLTVTGGVTMVNGNTLFILNPAAGATVAFTTTSLNLAGGQLYIDTGGTVELGVGGNIWGTTKAANGTVKMMAANVLPTTAALSVGVSYSMNGTVDLNGFSQTTGSLDGNYASGTRTVTSATAATLTLNQNTANSYNGQFTGALSVTKAGSATLTLGGASTHTGTTLVSAGTLALAHIDALQSSTLDTGTSGAQLVTFTVAGTNTYDLGGLKGADALAIGANSLNVGANNENTAYSGSLTGTGALTKTGSGTWLMNGSVSGLSQINVNDGTLGGTGTITGPVAVGSTGSLLGGDGLTASDDLAINGNVTLADNSVIKLTLGGALTHSTLTRTGGTWLFDLNQAFALNSLGMTTGLYTGIITGLTGTETGLSTINTWVITTPGITGQFQLVGNQVNLQVTGVPEPATAASLLGGVALLAGLRRRRRKV